jgi:DNA repair exonuclease SbcCD nuclease subunit
LYYLRESGLCKYNNIIFSVSSVFDLKVIPTTDIKINDSELCIAFHHGTLDGSKTDLGHILNSSMKISSFDGYDAVLLGDIHKYQYLDSKQRIYYAGSLIQLNHVESINYHGFLKWNLKTPKTAFQKIPNDYCFCTITIRNNEIIKKPQKLPTRPRIRYRIDQLTTDQKFAEILQQFRQKYQVREEIVDNLSIWGEPSSQ